MATIEDHLKQKTFQSEQLKAKMNLLFTANWLYHQISVQLKPFNLTHEQFNVLRILKGSHPHQMRQKDILERMIAPQSNLTPLVKKLFEKEWITHERQADDKRECRIGISAKGLALLDEVACAFKEGDLPSSNLSVSEAFHLNALLDKLRGD
jgi:DNA-binding MarR family transcriptional regulator